MCGIRCLGSLTMSEERTFETFAQSRILLVEDDFSVGRTYQRALAKYGYRVSLACTFQSAVGLLESQQFDVIISDICLDEQNGLAILEASKALNPDTPVILVTGRPTVETASDAVRLNAYEYLVKPIRLDTFCMTVAKAVKIKTLKSDKKKTALRERKYQHDLEQLVAARTKKLIQSQQRYQEQNRFLTDVIESLAHPFTVIEAANYHVKIANAAAKRNHIGQGTTCYELHRGLDKPCRLLGHRCILEEVKQLRRPVQAEQVYLDAAGNPGKHEVHAFPLFDVKSQVKQVIQYRIDITEKKRLESIAEAANLMDNLGYIFAGIRHEIGNPLNSVKMALSVLDKNLDRYPRQTIRQFVERSLGEVSRVEYLLKALKNFSIFETPHVEDFNMNFFLTNFKSLVDEDFSKKGIHIVLNLPSQDVFAVTDHRAFHQVLLNLLTNAADALAHTQRPIIEIMVENLSDFVQVQVRDNGCGMSAEVHANLFRPFYTSKPDGTGLGLMIVKKMLSKMNSSISIDSSPQQGSTVTMMLPQGSRGSDEKQ